jgi:hypothetical protein
MADETYIKMVLALPEEFFKDWQWKEGDQFLYRYNKLEPFESYYIGSFGVGVENGQIVTATNVEGETHDAGEYIPIPSQKQLLNIYKEKENCQFESLALLEFANWLESIVSLDHSFCLKYQESNEILLLFVMYKCFDKVWNGSKWI